MKALGYLACCLHLILASHFRKDIDKEKTQESVLKLVQCRKLCSRRKERKLSYRREGEVGRGYYKQSPLKETDSLKYSGFSLAELLPGKGKKKTFFLFMVIVKQCYFLPEMQSTPLPVGI